MSYPPIADLVPHQPPILAVERLLEWQPGFARAAMEVRAESVFVRDGVVAGESCLEFLAQTVAACLGYEAYRGGAGVRVGMVIASRRLAVERQSIAVGEHLELEVSRVRGDDEMSTYTGRVTDGDGAGVAEATLTLVHPERPPERS